MEMEREEEKLHIDLLLRTCRAQRIGVMILCSGDIYSAGSCWLINTAVNRSPDQCPSRREQNRPSVSSCGLHCKAAKLLLVKHSVCWYD